MPEGKGTYGSKRGRPPMKGEKMSKEAKTKKPASKRLVKGSKAAKDHMAKLRAMRGKK